MTADSTRRRAFIERAVFIVMAVFAATCSEPAAPPRPSNTSFDARALGTGFTISPANDTTLIGQTISLTAVGVPGGKQPTWTTSDTNVAIVVPAANGKASVTGRAAGVAIITASASSKSGSATVVVIPVPVRSVTVAPDSAVVQLGDSVAFVATPRDSAGHPLAGRAVVWSTPDTATASVSATGVARARARGRANIRAVSEGVTGRSVFIVAVPELAVPTIVAADSVSVADTLVVRYSVQNLGDTPVADSVIMRVGLRSAANAIVAAVRRSIPRVSSLGIISDSARFIVPAASPGAYTAVVYADCKDASGAADSTRLANCLASPSTAGTIAESNETNDAASATVVLRGPQLIAATLSAPDSALTRTTDTTALTLTNAGSATTVGFDVIEGLFDVTAGTVVTATDVATKVMAKQETRTVRATVPIPAGLDLSHQYQFRAFADCANAGSTPAARLQACINGTGGPGAIAESNENDNGAARGVVVMSNAARVNATPDTVRFGTLGDTATLAATAFDKNGAPVSGVSVLWTSLDSAASVSATGVVRALANGSARIVATIEGRADTTIAVVTQLATVVSVKPDTVLITVGATTTFTAEIRDASGAIVLGVRPTWTSLDPSIATVNDSGRVVSTSIGAARMVATANGHADTSVVFVNPVGYTHRWLGVTTLGWQDVANWYPHAVPSGATDSPFIPADAPQRPFLTGLGFVGSIRIAAGSGLDLRGNQLVVLGNLYAAGAITGGNVEMRNGGALSGSLPVLVVRGPTRLVGRTSATSVTVQDSTGQLTANGNTLVTPSLELSGGGGVIEANARDTIAVSSSFTLISSGVTQLSAGVLQLEGSFSDFGPPGSLVFSGSHSMVFDGSAAQPVVVADTNLLWHDIVIANNSADGVQLQSTIDIGGQLQLVNGGHLTSAQTVRFTTHMPDVSQGTYDVKTTAAAGAISLSQSGGISGNLIIESGAVLRLNGNRFIVPETLTVASAASTGNSNATPPGALIMDSPTDSLFVAGELAIAGSAQLSAGVLVASGDIVTNAGSGQLLATGIHTTVLRGQNAHVSLGSGSFFNNLSIEAAALVQLDSDVAVHGQLQGPLLAAPAGTPFGMVRSSDRSLVVTGGVALQGLVLDGTAASISGPRGTMQSLNNVTFQNSPAVPALLTLRMDGPGEFFMTNMSFLTPPVPGTFWLFADTLTPGAGAEAFNLSSPQSDQGPANTKVGTATVTWRSTSP